MSAVVCIGGCKHQSGRCPGRWKVTISLGGETMTGVALLKQTGDKVTGSIGPDERNQHPLDGVYRVRKDEGVNQRIQVESIHVPQKCNYIIESDSPSSSA